MKPSLKRQNEAEKETIWGIASPPNDANDAKAVTKAAVRPTMRFVPVKSADHQARSMAFKTHVLLVRQRNAFINAQRGHLMEYGIIAPPGRTLVKKLAAQIEDPDSELPPVVIELCHLHLHQRSVCTDQIVRIERQLGSDAEADPEAIRLQTTPGNGPVSAMAVQAFSPPLEGFKRGRDLAAWLGLVPVQKSTGGRKTLGRTSKAPSCLMVFFQFPVHLGAATRTAQIRVARGKDRTALGRTGPVPSLVGPAFSSDQNH